MKLKLMSPNPSSGTTGHSIFYTVRALWPRIGGPFAVLGTAAVIEILSHIGLRLPNPGAIAVLTVVYSAFIGGYLSGFISASLAWLYLAWFFSIPGQPFHFTETEFWRMVIWTFVLPLAVWMVGILKRRVSHLGELEKVNKELQHQIDERRHAEEALQLERDFSDAVLNSLPGVVYCYNKDLQFLRWNKNFERVLGYNNAEIARMSPLDFFVGPDRDLIQARIQEVFAKGASDAEANIVAKDGTRTPYYFTGLTTVIEGVSCLVGVGIDLSARKQAEAALRETQRQLTSLIANLPGVVYRCRNDLNWTTEFVSEGILQLFGYPAADFVEHRREIGQSLHPDDQGRVWEEIQAALRERRRYELTYRIITASGEEKWLWEQGAGVFDASGTLQVLEGFAVDITERKLAQERLHESEQRLRSILDTMFVFVGLMTLDGKIVEVNNAPLEAAGLKREDVIGRTVVETYWFSHSTAMQKQVRLALSRVARGETVREDYSIRIAGGRNIIIDTTFAPLRDISGRVTQIVGSAVDITERKRSETALRESEQHLRLLAEQVPVGIFQTNAEGENLFSNARWCELTGLTPEQALGKGWVGALHPDDRAAVADVWAEATRSGGMFRMDHRLRTPEGVTRWVSATALTQRDLSGNVMGYLGTVFDITERKRSEAALREAESRLRLAVTASNIGLWDWNLVTNDVYFSREWKNQLGYTEDELPNRFEEWQSRLHPDDLAPTLAKVRRFIEDPAANYAIEFRLRHKDGSWRWIFTQAQVFRDASGKPVRMMGCHIDITERKQAEEKRRQSEEKFSNVFHVGPAGMTITRIADGRFVDVNESFLRMFECSRDEAIGHTSTELNMLSPEERGRLIQAQIESGGLHNAELLARAKSGRLLHLLFSSKPMQVDGEDCLVTTLIDISGRKQAETALRESEARLKEAQRTARIGSWNFVPPDTIQWSDEMYELMQFPRDARVTSEAAEARIHPEDLAGSYNHAFRRALESGAVDYVEEFRLLRPDGSVLAVISRGKINRDANGKVIDAAGTLQDITERKQAEQERQKFVLLAESSSEFIGMCDLDLQPLYVNPAGRRMVGLPDMDAACRVKVQDYFFPEDRPFITEEFFPRVLREGHDEVEIRLRHFQTGEPIWMSYYLFQVRDAGGRVIGWATVSRDITERKRAVAALRESEERLRLALDAAHMGTFDWDVPHNRINWSRWHEDLWGFASGEFGGTYEAFTQRVHPDDLPGINAEVARCIATGEPFSREFRVVWPDGSVHWVAGNGEFEFNDAGKAVRMRGVVVETTARKQVEQKLAETEAHFHHLVNSSPSVIYATTLESRKCIYVSETLTRMTGYEPQEMLTDSELWFSCVHPGDIKQTLSALESQMQQGEGTLEYRFRKKDGEYLWINDNFRFIRDASGKPVELVGSWTDITASRRTEEQLAQAQKMEALGQLTGGIAHDFNNRLTVIMGNLELLQRTSGMNPAETDLIKTALLSADGAASLTRELLTFSRQQVLEFAVVNINELITSMRDMMRRTLGETINVVISPETDLWPARTDHHLLENVLLNLAVNARDAMPKGGQLTFETHNVRLDKTYVETHAYVKPGDYVLLSVSDTGQGMSEEIKRRVFEPFFTTKGEGKGTGLGLAMVYGFVKQSGGHVEIYSEPGHGTTFNLYFPKVASTAVVDTPLPPATAGEEEAVIRDKTILLVEDEATVRNIVVSQLGNLGCRVLSADNGPAALEIFAKIPDIDLLFTDMIMPGGMTGLELAAKMRERMPELKVLYTSGYAPQAAADRRTIEHPNDFWLAKPYRFKTLKNIIIKVFGHS